MRLTVSKRFEFSSSRRLYRPEWSDQENVDAFGTETAAFYGTGRNYAAYFVFSGPINPENGMLINVTDIKKRITGLLRQRYDHKFLNKDNAAFAESPPTAARIASQLLSEASPSFTDLDAELIACHLTESPEQSATAYKSGMTETNYWTTFSAARQTMSPNLTEAENTNLFGIAASPSGHGHFYRLRITVNGVATDGTVRRCLKSITDEMDHRNLNTDVSGLRDLPKTTESLARYLFTRASAVLPVTRVRLHEREDFFSEYHSSGDFYLSLQGAFCAAHRLHSSKMYDDENERLYGKCHNAEGHGHRYVVEATVAGELDERSGTLKRFEDLCGGLNRSLDPWRDKYLDREINEFQARPSTGENIISSLWPQVDANLNGQLARLRLWETPNNRFTLRREISAGSP